MWSAPWQAAESRRATAVGTTQILPGPGCLEAGIDGPCAVVAGLLSHRALSGPRQGGPVPLATTSIDLVARR
jgi:hypothetical protein